MSFVPHATAGLALMERGSGSEDDLLAALERLLLCDDRYRACPRIEPVMVPTICSPALVSPSVTLPVLAGQPALGTWQSLLLVDLNLDNPRRQVRFSFLPARD